MLTDYYTKRIFDRQNTPLDSFFNAAYNETVNVKNYCMQGEVWRSISEIEELDKKSNDILKSIKENL